MTIYFDAFYEEDEIAPDYEADSWEDMVEQLGELGAEISSKTLIMAYENNQELEVNGLKIFINSVE